MVLADYIEKIDNFVITIYNVFARIIFFFSFNKRVVVSKNKELKNEHIGERCFILLNGPSIKQNDLSMLEKEVTFVCNNFYKSDLADKVYPTYYCGLDPKFFTELHSFEKAVFEKYPNCKIIESIKAYDKKPYNHNCYYVDYYHLPTSFCVTHNFASISSGFHTVAYFAINAAIYMGFKEIYVLGLDFEPTPFTHFYDREINTSFRSPKDYWEYTRSQYESEYLNKHAKKCGVSIYNLNRNSFIRSFAFKEYRELFSTIKKPNE